MVLFIIRDPRHVFMVVCLLVLVNKT